MGGGSTPCASCKLLRRRCAKDCIFAPYFPPDDPHKFAIVHKVFGASNVSKMLQELPVQQRADAVSSLVYEANARMRDPVYGCVGAISYLQNQVSQLQMQLAVAQAEILCIQMQQQDHHQQSSSSSSYAAAYNNNLSSLIPSSIINTTPRDLDDDADDDKALFFSSSSSSNNFNSNLQNYLNFASTTSSAVMQDPLKRESLWT